MAKRKPATNVIRPDSWRRKRAVIQPSQIRIPFNQLVKEFEASLIRTAFAHADGNGKCAARCLGISIEQWRDLLQRKKHWAVIQEMQKAVSNG